MSTDPNLDPRWKWIHVPEMGNPNQWIKGECNHLTPEPVHAQPTDELVAYLCPDCNVQLPAEWRPAARSGGPVTGLRPFVLEDGEEIVPLTSRPHEPGARPTPLSRLLYP